MRIGYDAKRAFKNFTGLGNYSRSVISIMSDFYPQNEYLLYTPPYDKEKVKFSSENIKIIQPKGLWHFFNSFWRSFSIAALLKKNKVDIYHGLSHELPSGIKKSRAKSIVTMHDLIVLRYPHLYKPADRKIYLRKYKYACTNADLVIAISEQTKQDLIDFMGVDEKKIRLVYQGCDPQFYEQKTEQQKAEVKSKYNLPDSYILNVGTIEPRKKLLTIVKALPFISPELHLVVVGKPTEYMKEINSEITKNNLTNRVHFLHKLPFNNLPTVYQQAKVFVYPSVFEGFGIPILEALNSRIPVIAANTSSLPEVGGNAALYIEPDDYETLAKSITEICENPDLQQKMIETGITQATKFREDIIAKELWKVYTEL